MLAIASRPVGPGTLVANAAGPAAQGASPRLPPVALGLSGVGAGSSLGAGALGIGTAGAVGAVVALRVAGAASSQRRRPRRGCRASVQPLGLTAGASAAAARGRVWRAALQWKVLESTAEELAAALGEVAAKAAAAATASGGEPSFALLSVPPKWASDLAEASGKMRASGGGPLPSGVPVLGTQSGGAESVRLALACGAGPAQAFFANKEDLSQAGGGLAKSASASVPGVPDGCPHASFLLFADPAVPGTLTRNLLEALDSRYPDATKAGLVVLPAKAAEKAEDAKANAELEEWEPPKDGSRRLRPRDRSDGHGWISGDPAFIALDEEHVASTHVAEFTKRPTGVRRYCPGHLGKGAMVLDMVEKARYKGDHLGQAATQGVEVGMVLKTVNGADVRGWEFEDIMDLLNDEGIMDPDSKSAAEWGSASGLGPARQPVEPAEIPMKVEYVRLASQGASRLSPLCLNGEAKRDGVLGLALPSAFKSALDLFGCSRVGPVLVVKKSGLLPQGGFAVHTVEVNGKELAAAGALKMAAKAAGLQSMKGMYVGMPRPDMTGSTEASQWALFAVANVTKEGGLVLRCKGLGAEGLGTDDALTSVQLFCPTPQETAIGRLAGFGLKPESVCLGFATKPEAFSGMPASTMGVVGAAVLGAAGAGGGGAPTRIHRQAVTLVDSSD
mmetsp:Transcript_125183/g.279284  ORF Transcript_125183/g.279284 Transcript_125183/m.279284 type:complete len:674 (-) Transcript_125183:95-2116(-)